jgi:Lrp/AsnC family transcriptional regulator, leucine-responsive regulatory protein
VLDPTDVRILGLLQADGRMANADVAREVGMAPSAVFERIKKLEQRGYISGYQARLAPDRLELGLLAFVFVRVSDEGGGVGERLAKLEEVLEVHQVAGEDCYLVKLRVKDTQALGRLLNESIKAITGTASTRTTIALQSLKETLALPLAHLQGEAGT